MKRDRIQIIAEILISCKNPQTQTYIRRQTNISYTLLQSCIMQLLLRRWLVLIEEGCGQKKLIITEKGLIFLEKLLEIQKIVGIKSKRKSMVSVPDIQPLLFQSS
jgi:predicted transcriptional regulator